MLLKDYTPNLDRLPSFLMRLGPQVRISFSYIYGLWSGSYFPPLMHFFFLQVNWTAEKECFRTFLRELAFFYSTQPGPPPAPSSPSGDNMDVDQDEGGSDDLVQEEKAERWQIEHVLMPAVRDYFIPPKNLLGSMGVQSEKGKNKGGVDDSQSGSAVVQVASLPDLYRVFERC